MTIDAAGNRTVTVAEPRFNRREVAQLLAARRAQNAPRGSHGYLISEATDPVNTYKFRAGEPVTDFAAEALRKAQDNYKRQWPTADLSVLHWPLDKG